MTRYDKLASMFLGGVLATLLTLNLKEYLKYSLVPAAVVNFDGVNRRLILGQVRFSKLFLPTSASLLEVNETLQA